VVDVWGTNRCDLSVSAEGTMISVCTVIDNLVKGAAGQAVQNANIMNGWDETSGLLTPMPTPV
jgi:N-acetyl-gamma-glutamyl-phosphate reductase